MLIISDCAVSNMHCRAVKVQELTRLQLSKQRGQDLFERSHSAAQANERELIAIREEKRAVDDEKSIVLSQVRACSCNCDVGMLGNTKLIL